MAVPYQSHAIISATKRVMADEDAEALLSRWLGPSWTARSSGKDAGSGMELLAADGAKLHQY